MARRRPSHIRYVVMAFLCLLSFLTYFDRVCIMRAQGDIQRDLHIADAGIKGMGVIFGVFWLAYAIFEIPGGWLGERNGARRTLTRVVLVWSIFTALSGAAVGFWSLLACRFIFGAGEAGAYPNMARVQSRWLPAESQGRASGLLWMIARWGAALSPILFGSFQRAADSATVRTVLRHIAGPIANVPGWRLGFFMSGFLGIAWILLFYPWFRDDPSDKHSVNAAELNLIRSGGKARPKPQHDARVWRDLFTSQSLWGLALVYVFGSFGWSFFVSWMPKFLLKVHHITYANSERMSAMPMLCGGIASLLGGSLSDVIIKRMGRKRLGRALFPVAGHIVAAVAIFGLRYANTTALAVTLMCITMAAYDLGLGAKWAAIIDVGGAHAGIAAGFVNMMGNLGGNFLQPIIGAWIFTKFGWGPLFAVYAATYLLSASMWLFIQPDRHFYREEIVTR